MTETQKLCFKDWIDKFLVFNLFVIVGGFFLFIIGGFLSFNGNNGLYNLFQNLWFPLFIPALSTFFTAVLIDVAWRKFYNK
tara:strand:- start:1731 stop:1973 length:243 start_codon:yes stop_codon:yes gene_type:complete